MRSLGIPLGLRMASKGIPARSEEKGAPMIEPNYRIVHIVDVPAPAVLEAQRLGFGSGQSHLKLLWRAPLAGSVRRDRIIVFSVAG